tara:strand:+ start:1033 stop:1767 length:735 start_codon:yes stop_codon:yes gene_type:complete
MDLNQQEINLINEYIPTLKRYFDKNIKFKYFKNPFIENFLFKLVLIKDDSILISKIIDKINNDIISTEDICFSMYYYYSFSKIQKINIQNFLYKDNENEMVIIKLKTNIILFLIKYYQYYYIINELLFENSQEDLDELFFSIYLFFKNKEKNINKYSKKYFKMKILFYLLDDLFKIYQKNIDILLKNEIIKDINVSNFFIKNILNDWNTIYKKYLDENNFNKIQEKYEIKNNILYNLICKNNIC